MSTMVMCQENSTTPAMFQRYPSPPVNSGFSGFGYGYPSNQHPQDYNQFPMTDPSVQQAWYNAMYGGRADEWGYGTPTSSSPPGMGSYPYRTGTMGIDYSQAGQGMTSQTMDSPGNTSSSSSNSGSPSNKQLRPPYDWMKKAAFQGAPVAGKTRTKDKYRVVYSDHQRLELEKEFHYSRYITIRRKAELAQSLALSERQVKIWFQNRRAKERKQNKKRDETSVMKMGDMSPELAEENKQQIQQHMNLQMNAHAQHQIRLQTPSPSPVHGQPQYQVPTQCQGHSLQTSESPLNAISPSHSASPNHLFSPQGQLAMTMSPVNAHTSPASCSVTPPITIKTDLDAQDSMTSCV